MPLDFYDISDIQLRQKLFEISHADFEALNEALTKLKEVSSIAIDPYGTTRIYPNNVKLIISLIRDQLSNAKIDIQAPKRKALNLVLGYLETVSDGLLIIGD